VNTSGEAIIPYAYGGFANMKFDFVDQGSGFYLIHTVNGTQDLCLTYPALCHRWETGKK